MSANVSSVNVKPGQTGLAVLCCRLTRLGKPGSLKEGCKVKMGCYVAFVSSFEVAERPNGIPWGLFITKSGW
jgi:hypothetical protein